MGKSSNKAKAECLKLWLTTLKRQPKKEKKDKVDYKVDIKGFK